MAISTEGKLGIAVGLIALAGGGAVVVAPAPTVTIIGWAMIGTSLVGGILLVDHHFARKRMVPLIGMIVCAVGSVAFAGWYFWPKKNVAAATFENIAGSLFIECSMMTPLASIFPQEGQLLVVNISRQEIEKNKINFVPDQLVGKPGDMIRPLKQTFPPIVGSRCEVINDTGGPLLDVAIPFAVQFEKDNNNAQYYTSRNLLIPRLDSGSGNKFVIYFRSQSIQFVDLRMPKTAYARTLDENTRREIQVRRPNALLDDLVPLINLPRSTSPPASAPPTQEQPASPGKTRH
jgi:hypothetical protein